MAFSEDVVRQAWERSGEQCECNKRNHRHFRTPCAKPLVWGKRGTEERGGWEARHATPSGGDELSNCLILCSDCDEQQPQSDGISTGIEMSGR